MDYFLIEIDADGNEISCEEMEVFTPTTPEDLADYFAANLSDSDE